MALPLVSPLEAGAVPAGECDEDQDTTDAQGDDAENRTTDTATVTGTDVVTDSATPGSEGTPGLPLAAAVAVLAAVGLRRRNA